jgi:hypothetical protein
MRSHPRPIVAPAEFTFGDLGLRYDHAAGTISLVQRVLVRLIEANGLDVEAVLADETKQRALIAGWYLTHIEAGGAPDPVIEFVGSVFFPTALANDVH